MTPDELNPTEPTADDAAQTPTDLPGDAPEVGATPEPAESTPWRLVTSAERSVEAPAIEASLSAIASAKTGSLEATASAIGIANVAGDSDVRFSTCSIMFSKGNGSFHQAYASAFIAGNEVAVSQGGAPLAVGRKVSFEQGGSLVTLAGKAKVRRSFVGVLMAANAEVSEDTRILLTGKGVLILAAALLGGFGILAVAMYLSASRVAEWRPNISLPSWARRA